MRYQLSLFLLTVFFIMVCAFADNFCRDNYTWCQRSEQCCSGYCKTLTTNFCAPVEDNQQENPCAAARCEERCIVTEYADPSVNYINLIATCIPNRQNID